MNGTVIRPNGTAAIENTPSNLFGITRNKLNVGKKYHSGKISNGVANGSAGSPNVVGSRTPKPIQGRYIIDHLAMQVLRSSYGPYPLLILHVA